MPRYDFLCEKCNKQYEVQAPVNAEVKCPNCKEPMPKVPAKIRFKVK